MAKFRMSGREQWRQLVRGIHLPRDPYKDFAKWLEHKFNERNAELGKELESGCNIKIDTSIQRKPNTWYSIYPYLKSHDHPIDYIVQESELEPPKLNGYIHTPTHLLTDTMGFFREFKPITPGWPKRPWHK